MKKKSISVWIPTFVTITVSIVCTVYYTIFEERLLSTYLQLLVGAFVPLLFPVIGVITKKQYCLALPVACAVLTVFGVQFAKGLNFYGFIPNYDKVLHTNFGLVGTAMLYALLLRWDGDKMPLFAQFVFIFLGVLGLGALWEIFEFICSLFTGEDPQRCWLVIKKAIETGELGANPVTDTMQDLMVTAIGSAVFMIGYFADLFIFKGKCYKKLFSDPNKVNITEK